MMERKIIRNRWIYAGLAMGTILLGLYSRSRYVVGPQFLIDYSGDTLWALMVFWVCGFLMNRSKSLLIGFLALSFCYCIELSQLYHAPWIDLLRNNKFGGLVLGYGFKYSDLLCYSVGVLFGVSVEYLFRGYYRRDTT